MSAVVAVVARVIAVAAVAVLIAATAGAAEAAATVMLVVSSSIRKAMVAMTKAAMVVLRKTQKQNLEPVMHGMWRLEGAGGSTCAFWMRMT
jgi:hypothetical protein